MSQLLYSNEFNKLVNHAQSILRKLSYRHDVPGLDLQGNVGLARVLRVIQLLKLPLADRGGLTNLIRINLKTMFIYTDFTLPNLEKISGKTKQIINSMMHYYKLKSTHCN
jgi:hypothetical protein